MPTKRERYRDIDRHGQPITKKARSFDPEYCIKKLNARIPCREKQISQLFQLIGMPNERLPPSIFLHGLSSTGKTLVVSKMLAKLQCRYAIVSCECSQPKLLFEPILNSLTKHTVRSDNKFEPYAKCENTMQFIKNLKAAAVAHNFAHKQLFIVLENCEHLRSSKDGNLLSCLLHLQEFTMMNICVIFTSDVSFENFAQENMSLRPPIIINFPQYNQDEFVNVLLANFITDKTDERFSKDFQRDYVALLVRVCYRDCRNLNELLKLMRLYFDKYCEPVVNGAVALEDPGRGNKLWRQLRPHLGNALENLQFRTKPLCDSNKANDVASSALTFTESWALAYELPYYTKYLLVAAYLASYNPEKSDQRVFFKALAKQKKRKPSAATAMEKLRVQTLGPKFFALDRLYAIFYAVIDEKLSLTVNLQAQISSLVKLELLASNGDNFVESPKLKCSVSLDFIKAIARNLGLDIERYIFNLL